MWLRSPGDVKDTAGILTRAGQVFQFFTTSSIHGERGLIYPALWVGSGIFGDSATINVIHKDGISGEILKEDSYKVSPGNYGPYNAETFTGYRYIGLAGGSAPVSGTIRANETITITHLYEPAVTVTLIYDPNGGEGDIKEIPVLINNYQQVTDQDYTRVGYEFSHWNTQKNDTGLRFYNNQNIYMNDNITLYAQWDLIPLIGQVKLTYHPNRGIGDIKIITVTINNYQQVKSQGYKKDGSRFNGWNTRKDGKGVMYRDDSFIYMNDDITLYALWGPDK
jgi:uncharacterized repeat protein (TIGR02543 family)